LPTDQTHDDTGIADCKQQLAVSRSKIPFLAALRHGCKAGYQLAHHLALRKELVNIRTVLDECHSMLVSAALVVQDIGF